MKSVKLVSGVRFVCCALLLQIWLAPGASAAENPAPTAPDANAVSIEPNGPPPKIYFEQTTYDFGQVAPGSSSSCLFKFCNKGEGVLEINNVNTTCGCTVADLQKKIYAPGECGEIKVTFTADKATGQRLKHLYVVSNDLLAPRVELTIKALQAEKVAVEPDRLDFSLKGDNSGQAQLTIKSLDGKPFSITKFESTADIVTADFNANENAPQIVIKTKVDAARIGSITNGHIEISISHPETKTVGVAFTIMPKFRTDPPAMNIVNAEPGKPVQKELWVLSNYDEDFEITGATSRQGAITILSKEKLGNRYKINIQISPPPIKSVARMFTDTLSIDTKAGDKIDVACRGFYVTKPK